MKSIPKFFFGFAFLYFGAFCAVRVLQGDNIAWNMIFSLVFLAIGIKLEFDALNESQK